jgi:hypothetical protein
LIQIAERPITGTGRYGLSSEKYFWRGWLRFALLSYVQCINYNQFIWTCVACRRFGYEYGISLLFGLFMGLIAGSIFEGYLVEIWGVPIIVWILLTVSSGMQRVDRQRADAAAPEPRRRREAPTLSVGVDLWNLSEEAAHKIFCGMR